MGNIFNYIAKYGNKTFDDMNFNEVDAAIFANLTYVDFVGIIENDNSETTLCVALEKFLMLKDLRKYGKNGVFNRDVIRMCRSIKDCLRYRNITIKNYVYILSQEEQFGALTLILPNKQKIIAYEGTDHNLVSWEEDFTMVYKYPVPADVDSIKYIKNNIGLFDKNVILLGHSKGGHLAMNAASFSPWYIRHKIGKVYNLDGPGFRLREVSSKKYKKMEKKLEYIIPYYSVIGLLLRHGKPAKVVKSDRKDLLSHSPFSWEVKGTKFVLEPLSTLSKNLSRSIIMWLEMHDDEQRERIVTDVFDCIKKSKINSISDVTKIRNIVSLVKNMDELDDETKVLVKNFVKYNIDYHFNNLRDDIEVN